MPHLFSSSALMMCVSFSIGISSARGQEPSITIASPAASTSLTRGDHIPVTAEVTDPAGFVTKVEFFANGSRFGVASTAPYRAVYTNAPLGNLTLTALATDGVMVLAASAPVTMSVATTEAETLVWTGAMNRDWDNSTENWSGARTTFHADDAVVFTDAGAGTVFIGHQGFRLFAAPRHFTIDSDADYLFVGGDLFNRWINFSKRGAGTVTFSNLPAATFYALGDGDSIGLPIIESGTVAFDVTGQNDDLRFDPWGYITVDGGTFELRWDDQIPRAVTFGNSIFTGPRGGTLRVRSGRNGSGHARFDGTIDLGGILEVDTGPTPPGISTEFTCCIYGGGTTNSGLIRVGDTATGDLIVSAGITGASRGSGPLRLGNRAPGALQLMPSWNNLSNDIAILPVGRPFNPEGRDYAVEFASEFNARLHNLTVMSNGLLRLLGTGNLPATSMLRLDGTLYITNGVQVEVIAAVVGGQLYSTPTVLNSASIPGFIAGEGSLRILGIQPIRLDLLPLEAGRLAARFTLQAGIVYRMEANETLESANWTLLQEFFGHFGEMAEWALPFDESTPARFFRIHIPLPQP